MIMNNKLVYSFFIALLILSGCVSKNYVIKKHETTETVSGIVFGRVTLQRFFGVGSYNADATMGRLVTFKNTETMQEYKLTGACNFVTELPVGEYELLYLGSPAGKLAPKEKGFMFTVKKGDFKYIGTIVGDRDLKLHLEEIASKRPISQSDIISKKVYGVEKMEGFGFKSSGVGRKPFLDFFIIDESAKAIEKLKVDFPHYSTNDITTDLMK